MARHEDTEPRTLRFTADERRLLLAAKHVVEAEWGDSITWSQLVVEMAKRCTAGEG